MSALSTLLPILTLFSLAALMRSEATKPTLRFERASFKVTFVQGDEKIQRVRLITDADTVKEIGIEKFIVNADDSIAAQATVVDELGEAVSVQQLFLRFLNKRTMEDNIYALRKKGRDMKLDFGLLKEIRNDLNFWQKDASYRVEMIYGDVKLVESGIWVITDDMRFSEGSAVAFKEKERAVFDFDVGVKWNLQPEFEAPIPEKEKRAGAGSILIALAGVMLPFFVMIGVWAKMGALKLSLPGKDKSAAIGFEVCVLAHVIVLGMFWWKWNIVTTWKVMGVLMIPTLVSARSFLRADEGG